MKKDTITFSTQMGQHDPAKELGKQALEIEEKELGARPERMGDLYSMMAAILSEVTIFASICHIGNWCQEVENQFVTTI